MFLTFFNIDEVDGVRNSEPAISKKRGRCIHEMRSLETHYKHDLPRTEIVFEGTLWYFH